VKLQGLSKLVVWAIAIVIATLLAGLAADLLGIPTVFDQFGIPLRDYDELY